MLSSYCQRKKGVVVERLDKCDDDDGAWLEATVEDTRTPPADQAAFRIDFPEWLQTLGNRDRHIALTLASSETTSATAKQYGMSPARVSQLRRELHDAWLEFQGEAVPA